MIGHQAASFEDIDNDSHFKRYSPKFDSPRGAAHAGIGWFFAFYQHHHHSINSLIFQS